MQLGKSLLGAILGAAVGIGLLIAAHFLSPRDGVWLAIPFALVTGLGVRMLVSTAGHASYARGVITMLIALAGYIGGMQAVTMIATAKASQPLSKPPVTAPTEPAEGEAKEEDTADAPVETPKEQQPAVTPPRVNVAQPRPVPVPAFGSTWDVIWLAIAALVAYEMGRGSGVSAAPASQSTGATPVSTHPDA